MAGREYREIRKRLSGAEASPYIGLARKWLGILKEQAAFQKLEQLPWRNIQIAPGVFCSVWSIHGQDGISIEVIPGPSEAPSLGCQPYLSGLLQDVRADLTHFYPARADQGFTRQWYDTWHLVDGSVVKKEKFTAQEERLYKIGWSGSPIYPHHFSGSMRKVAQKLAGAGKLATANLGTTWDRTHGLLSETYSAGDWQSGVYGSKRWLIEIAADGVYAMRVHTCNEAAQAGLTRRQWVELSQAARDKYDFLLADFKGYQRKARLAAQDVLAQVYSKQPLFPEYGWAFNYSGTEAQIIVWDWDGTKTYKVFYRYRLAIGPTSATLSEAEHGIYWWPKGVGGLQVPNYGCGTIETFISYLLGYEADDPYSPDPGDLDTPVSVYYSGDEEIVYRVKRVGELSSSYDISLCDLNGYNGFLESSDDCSLGPLPTIGSVMQPQHITNNWTGKTESFTSPLTFPPAPSYTGDSEIWGQGTSLAFNQHERPAPLSHQEMVDYLALNWEVAPKCKWGDETNAYINDDLDIYAITYEYGQDSDVSVRTTDSLTFPWNDRESMFHYRWRGKHAGARTLHTYVANGERGTNVWCRTPNPTDISQYVCSPYSYDYVSVAGGPLNIYTPNDATNDLGTVTSTDVWDIDIELVLATDRRNRLWKTTCHNIGECFDENIYTAEKTCIDGFLLDALVGAFDPTGWIATKNAALDLCGTVQYGLELQFDTGQEAGREGEATIHDLNIFSSYFVGQETEQ